MPDPRVKMLVGGFRKHLQRSMFEDKDIVEMGMWLRSMAEYVLNGGPYESPDPVPTEAITNAITDRLETEGPGDPDRGERHGEVDFGGVPDPGVP